MFKFIEPSFFALLCFSGSLAWIAKVSDSTKYIFLNNEPCLVKPTLVDLDLNELHIIHYLFIISLARCNGTYNTLENC